MVVLIAQRVVRTIVLDDGHVLAQLRNRLFDRHLGEALLGFLAVSDDRFSVIVGRWDGHNV